MKTIHTKYKLSCVINSPRLQKRVCALLIRTLTGVAVMLSSSDSHGAAVSTINAYIGLAKTLKSFLNGFLGYTTVTPACALGRWDHYDYGIYGRNEDGTPHYFGQHLQVMRCYYTGDFKYLRELRDEKTGKWFPVDREPIMIPRIARLTSTCVPNPSAPFIYNTLEDFSLQVWAASVQKKGYFPPKEPYDVYMKFDGTSCQYNCADVNFNPRQIPIRSPKIAVRDSGVVSFKMPIVQYEYSFPPLLWVGNWSDY